MSSKKRKGDFFRDLAKCALVRCGIFSSIFDAVLLFSFLDEIVQKILCLMKSEHPGRKETLAEYYGNTYKHLLRDVIIYEVSKDGKAKRIRPIASL